MGRTKPTDSILFMKSMWGLVHALDVRSKRMEQTLGVTSPQRLVIRIVGQKPNQTATEISDTLGKHPSTLTGVLARLEARGLLVRDVDAEDRRRARFKLTAAGKKIDREKRGTVEAAVTRAIGRSNHAAVTHTLATLDRIVAELARED